jgi:hypothetical protein
LGAACMDDEMDWVSRLEERASKAEDKLIRPTTRAEEEFIAARIDEDKKVRAAKRMGSGEDE